MSLLTNEIKGQFKRVGDQKYCEDPIVICRFYLYRRYCGPSSYPIVLEWLMTEYNPKTEMFFGYHRGAWNSFDLNVLRDGGVMIDKKFKICRASECIHDFEVNKQTVVKKKKSAKYSPKELKKHLEILLKSGSENGRPDVKNYLIKNIDTMIEALQ